MQIVLQWSSSQEQSVAGLELSDSFRSLTFLIFNFMGFVNNYILPIKFLKSAHTHSDTLESCDTDIKIARQYCLLNDVFAELLFGDQIDHFDGWVPSGELLEPVSNNGLWHYNQVVAFDLFKFSQEGQQ